MVLVLIGHPAPVGAGGPTSAAAGPSSGRVALELVDHPVFVHPGGEIGVSVRFRGPVPPDALLAVTVHGRVTSRSAFTLTTTGSRLGPVVSFEEVPVADLPRTGGDPSTTTITWSLAPQSPEGTRRLPLTTEGVYPVAFELRTPGGETLDGFITHLVVLPPADDASPPLGVAWLGVAVSAPARQPDGRVRPPAAVSSAAGLWAAALTGDPPPVVLRVTPEPWRAATGDGGGRPTPAAAVPAPWVEVDRAALAARGLSGEADAAYRRGLSELTAAFAEVDTSLGVIGPGLADPPASVGAVLVQAGVVELPVLRLSVTRPVLARTAGGVRGALVADPGLSAHLRLPSPTLAAARLLADLSVLYFEQPAVPRGVLVEIPGGADPRAVTRAFDGVRSASILTHTAPGGILALDPQTDGAGDPLVVTLPDLPRGGADGLDELVEVRHLIDAAAGAAGPDPTLEEAAELLAVAPASNIAPARRSAYVQQARARVAALLGGLEVASGTTVTLTGREGQVPVVVRSSADRPLRVQVCLVTLTVELPGGGCRTVNAGPGNTTVPIAVRVRSAGTFSVEAVVRTPDGSVELSRGRIRLRSTAVSGVGLILSVGAAAFLVLWWARHWRSSARSGPVAGAADGPTGGPHR